MPKAKRKCRVCGCTDDDCSQCIEKTGKPCFWVELDLCSACVDIKKPFPKHWKPEKKKINKRRKVVQ